MIAVHRRVGGYDDAVTTALDVLGLLLVAAAAGVAVMGLWRWSAALAASAAVVFAGVRLAEWMSARRSP